MSDKSINAMITWGRVADLRCARILMLIGLTLIALTSACVDSVTYPLKANVSIYDSTRNASELFALMRLFADQEGFSTDEELIGNNANARHVMTLDRRDGVVVQVDDLQGDRWLSVGFYAKNKTSNWRSVYVIFQEFLEQNSVTVESGR